MPSGDRFLFLEAWLRIAAARLFFRRARVADDPSAPGSRDAEGLARIERLFLVALRHHPGAVPCAPRSRALHGLLARRGHPVSLRVGLRRGAEGPLEGHAWVESAGRTVAEAAEQQSFAPLNGVR